MNDGSDRLSPDQSPDASRAGSRLVVYEYCISFVFITLRRASGVYRLRPGESGRLKGLPYTLLTLVLGWWGVPWGILYTPLVVLTNLSGGRVVDGSLPR
ncbi:MAG TPA: hypothetical protein VKE94_10445 [Gemmataceae bacterium]|nr:hypothetical protein [Gemmataceae bacterium]